MDNNISAGVKEVILEAVITRADGTVENLGQVSYWHKNPLMRLKWNLVKTWNKVFKGSK